MNLHALSQLPSSADVGWPDLIRARPSLPRIFAFLVLPLSLLPPPMLYWAGTRHPEMFPPEFARQTLGRGRLSRSSWRYEMWRGLHVTSDAARCITFRNLRIEAE